MDMEKQGPLWLPKKKEKKTNPLHSYTDETTWDCPHCGVFFDREKQDAEEATVGTLVGGLPHMVCPSCKECMGCDCERD